MDLTSIQKNNLYETYFGHLEVGKLYKHNDIMSFTNSVWLSGEKIRYYSLNQYDSKIFISENDIFIITKKAQERNWVEINILFGTKIYYRDFFFSSVKNISKQIYNLIE